MWVYNLQYFTHTLKIMIKEKEFQIWSEGYTDIGIDFSATHIGKSQGKDFKDACVNFAKKNQKFDECVFFKPIN